VTSVAASVDAVGPAIGVCECYPMVDGGIELVRGIMEEEAIGEEQGRKEEGEKGKSVDQEVQTFLSPFVK
jgi:hypothetical protein